MKKKTIRQALLRDTGWRRILLILCEAFCLYTAICSGISGEMDGVLLCVAAMIGLVLPYVAEGLWGWRMSGATYVFFLFYVTCSMMGRPYRLYYTLAYWDKLLHLCGGLAFALAGSYLLVLRSRSYRRDLLVRAVFALCFSIAVSAVWEFYEFGADHLLGMDMQRDTVVHSMDSYFLGNATGEVGHMDHIDSVIVNGVDLGLGGYVDLGLIDTMGDMMIETLGALVYVAVLVVTKGKYPAIYKKTNGNEEKQIK